MINYTIIELKTCTTFPGVNSKIHHKNMMQLAMQIEIMSENEGLLETPGLVRTKVGDSHIYTLNGKDIPGITTILKQIDSYIPDPIYLKRGTWAHKTCEKMDEGGLAEKWLESLPMFAVREGFTEEDGKLWRSWFEGYQQFKEDYELNQATIYNEKPFASAKWQVAATIDKLTFDGDLSPGVLLYLSKNGYKHFPLRPSKGRTSKYKIHLSNVLPLIQVYNMRRDIYREKYEWKENKEWIE